MIVDSENFTPPGTPLLRDPQDTRIGGLRVRDDIALVGIPWDWGITGRPGSRETPAKLRSVLYSMRTFTPGWGTLKSKPMDLGDIRIAPGDWSTTSRRVRGTLKSIYNKYKLVIIFGGDHSISEWTISPLLEEGSVGLLLLDAHYDMRSTVEGYTSGAWLWNLHKSYRDRLKAGIIGISPYANPVYLHERAREAGYMVLSSLDIMRDPQSWEGIVKALESMNLDYYYISIDIDHIDQSYAPGVNSPSPLGLTPIQSLEIIGEAVSRLCPKGIDIVEIVPAHDPTGSTLRIAGLIVARALHVYMEECK